jgi:hemolysin activation/secretion protein
MGGFPVLNGLEPEKEMASPTGLCLGGPINRFRLLLGVCLFILVGSLPALAQESGNDARAPILSISAIEVRYAPAAQVRKNLLPAIEDVEGLEIQLGSIQRGGSVIWVKSTGTTDIEEGSATRVRLSDVGTLPGHWYMPSAMRSISEQITAYLNSRGIAGVYVEPWETDIAAAETQASRSTPVVVHFDIHIAIVRRVHTVETGEYYPGIDSNGHGKIDNNLDSGIVRHSPVQPTTNDIMQQGVVDDYVLLLNRQTGRQVEASLEMAQGPDSVALDYLVARSKPWQVYGQVSNTGTKETGTWIESLGIVDNQLTGNDDSLGIDYSTSGFGDKENVINATYDTPFLGLPWTRGKAYLGYEQFNASDFADNNVEFHGQTISAGGEISQNVFQDHHLFVDVIGGVRFENIDVNNTTSDISGNGNFFLPYFGVHLDRNVQIDSINADLTCLGSFSNSDQATRDALGRINAAQNAVIFQGDYAYSVFLEPLFGPRDYAAGKGTLANEFAFGVRGQYTPDRLIAEEQYVIGGLYTVRGYPQSIAAGDDSWVASAEYRLHIPRLFGVEPQPGNLFGEPFRWSPQQVYGRPDWDLILRGFVDAGQTYNTQRESFETNATLVGAGVGLELQYKDNADVRVDFGRAINAVHDSQTGATLVGYGSEQINMVFTFKY